MRLVLIALAALCLIGPPVADAQGGGLRVQLRQARAYDGDTIYDGKQGYRLEGIDTPESVLGGRSGARCASEKAAGVRAANHAKMLVARAKIIEARTSRPAWRMDRQRRVGRVYLDGQDLGERMIADGFAKRWDYYAGARKPTWC